MKGMKIGVLFLVSLMAIAGIGASYAMWFDTVDVNATATTGTLDYKITNFQVMDETEIGGTTATWTGAHTYPGQPQSITVTVQPTYPGWAAICELTVKNTGNLPLKMYSLQMAYVSGNSDLMGYYYWGIPSTTDLETATIYFEHSFNWWTTERTYAGDLAGVPIVTVQPGDSYVLDGYFILSSSLPQSYMGTPLTITLTLKATQADITL